MRKLIPWIAGVFGALLVAWFILGLLVWSRNRVPAPNLPVRAVPPSQNAYSDYVNLVRTVRRANEIFEHSIKKRALTDERKRFILRENAENLIALSALAKRPSIVTDLEPGV